MPQGFPYDRLVETIDRRHRAIVAGAVVLLVVSALSLFRVRLDMDLLSQLPSRSTIFREYREFLESFGVFDSLVFLVRGDRARIVELADALAARLAAIPEVGRVRYRVDLEDVRRRLLVPYRYELVDDAQFGELARRLEPGAIEERVRGLRRALTMPMSVGARRWVLADPLGIDELVGRSIERGYADPMFRPSSEYFLSPTGEALVLIARPTRSAFDTIFAEALLAKVHAAERELLDGPFRGSAVEIGHTGSYVYALADKAVLQRDLQIYFVLAPLLVLAIFHIGLRTLRILPFALFPLIVTATATFALSLVFFGSLNMVSVAFAGIFYGLGIDSSIYFYTLLRDKAAARGRTSVRALVTETLREIGAANVVASLTTASAFFVIGLSDFTGVSQLGIMTGVAMLLSIVSTFVLLPAMVFAWGERALPDRPAGPSRFARAYGALAAAISTRRRLVLGVAALVVAGAAFAARGVRLDTDFTRLRPGGGEPEEVEQAIRGQFGPVDAQGIAIVRAPDVERALRGAEQVAAALERYRSDGIVRSYSSLSAFLPSGETASKRLARFQSLPRAEAAATLRRSLESTGFETSAFEGALEDLVRDERPTITIEGQREGPLAALVEQHLRRLDDGAAVSTFFVPAPGVTIATIRERLERLRADAPPGTSVTATGRDLAEGEFARLLRRDLVWFLGGALVLNLGVLLAAERRLVSAVVMICPTLASLVVYLGVIGMLDVPIDPINLIVLPLLIGLGVDDTVYLIAHMRHGGGIGAGAERGSTPLLLAVGTTLAGFGSLGLSHYPALGRLGSLAALGLGICLVVDALLTPAIAGWLVRAKEV